MTFLSPRVVARVRRDFEPGQVDSIIQVLGTLPESLPMGGDQDADRVQAALVIPARGNPDTFAGLLNLDRQDWRDALVGAGLGGDDWVAKLDHELGNG